MVTRQQRIVRAHMALEAWRRGNPHHRPSDDDINGLLCDLMFLVANTGLDVESTAVKAITRYYTDT